MAALLGGAPSAAGRLALWRARRTMAATFAFGMGQLPESTWAYTAGRGGRGSDGRMLVWVVGACEAMEGQLSRRGLLAQTICRLWWPAREHGLELILCGPEMREWSLDLGRRGASRAAEHRAAAAAAASAARSARHAALAPRCWQRGGVRGGLGAAAGARRGVLHQLWHGHAPAPLVAPWLPTLDALLCLGTPTLFSCFNRHEAAGEAALLPLLGAEVLLSYSTPNPMTHALPLELIATADVPARASPSADADADADALAELAARAAGTAAVRGG